MHHGDQGLIGRLITETRGVLRFGAEGSGLIELPGNTGSVASNEPARPAVPATPEATVRIQAVTFSALPRDVQDQLGEQQVPCLLGHSGVETVTLLSARSCARVGSSLSDLRGKVRFSLARVGWEL